MPPTKRLHSMHAGSRHWAEVDEFLRGEIAARKPKPAEIERAGQIADELQNLYPDAHCALDFGTAFQLLVSTILSAQCTDERVNQVTPNLWAKYPGPTELAEASQEDVIAIIRSTGFFNNKATAVREAARGVVERFGGQVPRTIEELQTLRGAARKTANVVRMHAFNLPGLAVDTHFTRVTQRLGLTKATDPVKIEGDVGALLPPERWTHFGDAIIWHGRRICHAQMPKCEVCTLAPLCPSAFKAMGKNFKEQPARKAKKA